MNRNLWIAAAMLVVPLLPARADPLLTFGPDIPLFITGDATVRRDDNVFLTPEDKKSDTLFLLNPGFDMHYAGGEATAALTFNEQFVRYASNSELDDNLSNAAGNLGYNSGSSQVAVAASYEQEDQSTVASQSLDETLKHSVAAASLNGEWSVTAKTRIGAGASLDRTMYPEVGLVDEDAWSFPFDFYYAVSPKVDLSVGYRYDKTTVDSGPGDTSDQFFNVGARGDFTPKLSGQIRVGVTEFKATGQGDASTADLGFGTTLTYLLSPKTSIDLSADNGYTDSATGTSQKVLSIGSTGHFQLNPAWTMTVGGSFDSTQYLMSVPARTDDFWVGDIGLSYAWTSNTAFQMSYLFRKNASTLAAATFADDVLSLSASSRF
jgi:hypothetical protein